MRKVDELREILRRFKEQDDNVAALGSDPLIVPGDAAMPMEDNEFFKGLKMGDEFEDPTMSGIKYRVTGDPQTDEATGLVTSLPVEVIEAPEGNEKGVAVGDTLDAVSMTTEALATKKTNLKSSGKPYDISTGYPHEFPTTDKPGATPKKDYLPGPGQSEPKTGSGAPADPEKGKQVDAAESLKRKRDKVAKLREKMQKKTSRFRKLGEATTSLGIVNDIIEEGGQKMIVLRFGGNMIAKIPFIDGYKVGDVVEVEDMKKIIGKATK